MDRYNLNGQLKSIVTELVEQGLTLEQARQEFERQFILASLRSNGGNVSRSAGVLGVHRNTLQNKISSLGIGAREVRAARRRSNR